MKNILFAILVLMYLPAFGQNNIKKTAAVTYTLGPPTYTVSLPSSSEIAVDTSTGKIYQYHRTTSTWLQLGQGIDIISGAIPPAYTPLRNMSKFAINGDNELYYYTGSSWVQINAGSGGTGGHVILEGNTPRAQRDSMEFQSNSSIVLAATNTSTRTVVEATIESNAVGSAEIAANAVGSSEIAADAVGNSELAANAVDSTNVINYGLSVLDLGQHGASTGSVLKWNGTQWAPAADDDMPAVTANQIAYGTGSAITGHNRLTVDPTATATRLRLSGSGSGGGITIDSIGPGDKGLEMYSYSATATEVPFLYAERSGANAAATMEMYANDAGAASDAVLKLRTQTGGAGDPMVQFTTDPGGSVGVWLIGVDNDDSDRLKIGRASSFSSGTDSYAITADNTTNNVYIGNGLLLPRDITTNISTSQNDYNPSGFTSASTYGFTSTGNVNITGITAGEDGRVLILTNRDATDNITLVNESASSTAANRFAIGSDITFGPGYSAVLRYDIASSRWRCIAKHTASTADNWGSQVVATDATLVGDGTSGNPLSWNGASTGGPISGNGFSGTPITVLNDAITAQYIAASAVTSSEIRDTTIVTQDIKDGAVTNAKLAADAVGNSELAANAVDSTNVINYGLSVLDLGQHGASTGSVLKWNGTQWAPGSDNTVQAWAENTIGSPTYFPSLSDVIFHNGPVLIKEDTMHHWYHSGGYSNTETGLYIKHNSTSTYQNPAIHIRNYGPGTGGTNQNVQMVTMELDSLPAPSSVPFVMNMNYVDAASAAGDNTVWNMGLNMNKQGASYRAGQPSCLLQFESNYAAATAADQEIWFGFNPTSSGTFRPIYMTANRTDGSGSVTSLSGNTIYFSTGATALDKGVWTSDEFIVKNPTTNGNLFLTLQGNGTGSSVLRMRRPGDGSNYNALSIANSTTYLQLSDSYLDVKVGADIFSMDHANYGNAIISARYNSGSPNDTLDFGHYPGFGENYASHSNYRFTLSDGAAIYFGVYGNTIGNYGAIGQTNANDIFLHTGKVITTTEVALGVDRTTGNVGISKIISDIDSDAELQVGGKVQVDDVSGTTTKLSGWTSTSTLTDVVIGGGLSISGDTIRTAAGGGGIYGNGIAGSGNGDIPNGGSTATVTGDDPLILNLDAAAGQTNRMLRLVTDYSAEDAATKMLQLVAPTDSLIVISQDQSIVLEYKGPPSDGTSLTISSNQKFTVDATTGTVIKGDGTELSVVGETILGSGAAAPLVNQIAHGSGSITTTGDAQSSEVILRRTITGTSATELFLDGASIQAILPATNRIWTGTAKCSGSVTDVGNGATIVVGDTHARYQTFTVKRVGSSTTLMTAATGLTDTWTDTNMAGAAFTLTADNTTEALKITFTPPTLAGSTTVCKAVCTVNINELGF